MFTVLEGVQVLIQAFKLLLEAGSAATSHEFSQLVPEVASQVGCLLRVQPHVQHLTGQETLDMGPSKPVSSVLVTGPDPDLRLESKQLGTEGFMHWFLRCPCHTYFHALPKCTGKHSRAITACASAELFSARVIALPACSSKRLCLWLGAMESLGAADLRRCPTAHGASRTVRRAVFAFMKDAGCDSSITQSGKTELSVRADVFGSPPSDVYH